ncbi:heme-binding domain-containing protein [Flavobacteriaceae bacterium XHP0103]|uniref:heme-binding domain-containing protein n=1 Tax=Marixanthotalea marina TaxID=2844359 RepID=UPI002989F8B2|nr:heme-binding domain-containing protein [Marixanthotalea marina]MBU3821691.1 heme-binding domain-containing protein [Marixanthotalea marina]
MKILKKILVVLLVLFVVAQFFGPEKNEGEMTSMDAFYSETNPSPEVKKILEVSCNDCHSDVTEYPWYNSITPVNYWLASHVNDGKKHFNISNWEGSPTRRKDHKFEELIEMVEEKEMPLNSYTWTHTDAKLSDEQINALVDWAKKVRIKYSLEPRPE